eukprot:CAMPEP_0172506474 /NCGR_PEP_ID=MMETSP1066-20121228/195460_1 /TAXON_ID=671091 /ORGANISM="Coscinodiscus wailesii, Strain CCMP2513" /LENGTH=69 /DNA_ID=CAMNT_0013283523 /DNA_START=53 /DNA_END=258 /DNA_ORIENTATION=-
MPSLTNPPSPSSSSNRNTRRASNMRTLADEMLSRASSQTPLTPTELENVMTSIRHVLPPDDDHSVDLAA